MKNRRLLAGLGVASLIIVIAGAALSRRSFDQAVIDTEGIRFTDHYTLNAAVDDVVVFAETARLDSNARASGDVALLARGSVTVNGQLDGDLTVTGSDVTLLPELQVAGDAAFLVTSLKLDGHFAGDVIVLADRLEIAPGATIDGTLESCAREMTLPEHITRVTRCSAGESQAVQETLNTLQTGTIPPEWLRVDLGGVGLLVTGAISLALTGLAALAVTAFPLAFSHLAEGVQTLPRRMAGVGCLSSLLVIGAGGVLVAAIALIPVVGLLLTPFALLGGLFLLGMTVMGWITLALVIGDTLLRRLTRTTQPALVDAIFGSVLLFGLWHLLAALPYGLLITLAGMSLLGVVGLGAVVTTRLGTRPLRRRYFVQG